MKNLFIRIKENLKNRATTIIAIISSGAASFAGILTGKPAIARRAVANNAGEGYVDTALKILICVVIGALVLASLYALFGDTVMPAVTQRVRDMFNYNG